MDEDFKKLCAIIADVLGIDPDEITMDTTFDDDLGADSLDTVELIMDLEKEFNINISDSAAEQISTVGEAIKFIEEHSK